MARKNVLENDTNGLVTALNGGMFDISTALIADIYQELTNLSKKPVRSLNSRERRTYCHIHYPAK